MHVTVVHEGNGFTGYQQPHKITEESSIEGNDPNKIKMVPKIKGRTFTDVGPQRYYITKVEASPSTISLEDFSSGSSSMHIKEEMLKFFMSLEHTSTLTRHKIYLSC